MRIDPAPPDLKTVEIEIARLRDLDHDALRACWRTQFRRKPSPHLSRHLLLRMLAYRLQAERFGDLDDRSRRLLEGAASPHSAGKRDAARLRVTTWVRPGTVMGREWNGQMHRVTVLAEGFVWNGQTYPSLSKVAFAITGTRWNGPRFFGLRDRRATGMVRP